MPLEEQHPLKPFLPRNAALLMLGTFPPAQTRWCMDFFYPNFLNDMWRIFGLSFFNNKEYFVNGKRFDEEKIKTFLCKKGIALYDSAQKVVRLKDNASDKFLKISLPTDVFGILARIPNCRAIAATGEKAAETVSKTLSCAIPECGTPARVDCKGKQLDFYRLPSSSRAYPMPLEEKAAEYSKMFKSLGLL